MNKDKTTIGIWQITVPLLDRVCELNRRTRQEQIHWWTEHEARELGLVPTPSRGFEDGGEETIEPVMGAPNDAEPT